MPKKKKILVFDPLGKLRQKERSDIHHIVGNRADDEDTGHGDQHPGDGHLLAVRLCCRRLATSPRCRASQLDGRDDGGDGGGQEEEDGQSQPVHHAVKDVHQKPVVHVELAGVESLQRDVFLGVGPTPNPVFAERKGVATNEDSCTDNDNGTCRFGLQDLLGYKRMGEQVQLCEKSLHGM